MHVVGLNGRIALSVSVRTPVVVSCIEIVDELKPIPSLFHVSFFGRLYKGQTTVE